jgi:rod shape-determining protein MreD
MRFVDYVALPVLALLALCQLTLLPNIRILGVMPQLVFVVVLAWAILQGIEAGIVWAFIAGILLDLISPAPFGTTALVYIIVVLTIGLLNMALPENVLLPPLFALIGTILALFLEYIILQLFGFEPSANIITQSLPLPFIHAILIIPIYYASNIWERIRRPRPVQI